MMTTSFSLDAVLDVIGRRPGIADYAIAVAFFAVKDVPCALARNAVTRCSLRKDGLFGNWRAAAAQKSG